MINVIKCDLFFFFFSHLYWTHSTLRRHAPNIKKRLLKIHLTSYVFKDICESNADHSYDSFTECGKGESTCVDQNMKEMIKNNDSYLLLMQLCVCVCVCVCVYVCVCVSFLLDTQSALLHDQYQSISQHWLYNYREVKSVTHSHVEALTRAASSGD